MSNNNTHKSCVKVNLNWMRREGACVCVVGYEGGGNDGREKVHRLGSNKNGKTTSVWVEARRADRRKWRVPSHYLKIHLEKKKGQTKAVLTPKSWYYQLEF